jgi:hypothetical protein
MGLIGCAGIGLEGETPETTLNASIPPLGTFLAGTGGGAGEGLRLTGAEPVAGVDFDRTATALEDIRAGGANWDGLRFVNNLNSYLAVRCQLYEDKLTEDPNL